MRFRHPDGSIVHLAYCTNVHAAEVVADIIGLLERVAIPVRERLEVDRLGVGLWLAAPAVRHLQSDPDAVDALRNTLRRGGLEVVTLNGFPYRAFHAPVVKRNVYLPDWTEPERLTYTATLARLLARLMPDDVTEGSISTLPLGWRDGWTAATTGTARGAFARLADELGRVEHETGRVIRVGIEPEPGCVVETVAQALTFLRDLDPVRIGLCLDACHAAVQFEDPVDAVREVARAGIPIVKSQLSSALRLADPARRDAREPLRDFAEPRFLHQTRCRSASGVVGVDDLDAALDGALPVDGEWRVHFHLPIHVDDARTTQPELVATMAALVGGAVAQTHHLEVETYTWTVLPAGNRPEGEAGLVDGLARELDWARGRLLDLGLTPVVA